MKNRDEGRAIAALISIVLAVAGFAILTAWVDLNAPVAEHFE